MLQGSLSTPRRRERGRDDRSFLRRLRTRFRPAPLSVLLRRYVYSDLEPDICLIVDGDAVVTILTRELCQPARLRVLPRPSGTRTRQVTYSRGWDAESDWETYEALPAELAQIA